MSARNYSSSISRASTQSSSAPCLRCALRAAAELIKWQIRDDATYRAGIHDDLVGAREQPLYRLQLHALARHVGRLLVLLVHL